MNNIEIINKYYQEAVQSLDKTVLENKDKWYECVLQLPPHLQVVYTISILDEQVLNGGFDQYFINGYGIFAYLTLDFLKYIRAFKTANILERVLKGVNYHNWSQNDFRREISNGDNQKIKNYNDEFANFLNKLDDEYYELFNHPSVENLNELIAAFLIKYESTKLK